MLRELWKHRPARTLLLLSAALLLLESGHAFVTLPDWPAWVGLALALWMGRGVLAGALKALRQGRYSSIQLLISLAAVGATALGEAGEAATVLTLYTLSEALEDVGFARSYAELKGLVARAPKRARLKDGPEVAAENLRPGDVVVLRGGEGVPADGAVLAGRAAVDESAVTGEPLPQSRGPGDALYAGTLVADGYLELRVERCGADSTLGRIVALTYQAAERKLRLQTFLERFSAVYTPAVLAAALLCAALPILLGGDPATWLRRSLSLLVIACPCALTMATPIAAFAAISAAARRGAMVKGGRPLEALAAARVAAFDKTRTLSVGEPEVHTVRPLRGFSESDVLAAAAGLSALSSHPLSQAVLRAARRCQSAPHPMEDLHERPGLGLSATCVVCRDDHHCLGSPTFADGEHPLSAAVRSEVEALQSDGSTVIVVSDSEGAMGLLALRDRLRPGARAVIDALREQGLEPVILTGDHRLSAQQSAEALGVKKVCSGLLPADKAAVLAELQAQKGPAMMVGDGVNDAPALAEAAVGVALGAAGSDVAVENADIALMNDRLELLPWLRRLAVATVKRIRFNTAFAISAKLLVLGLSLVGLAGLEAAILSDVGVTVLVMLNGLRLLRFPADPDSSRTAA